MCSKFNLSFSYLISQLIIVFACQTLHLDWHLAIGRQLSQALYKLSQTKQNSQISFTKYRSITLHFAGDF